MLFPHLFAMMWWDRMPWSSFFECWVLSQLFHSSFTFMKRHFGSSLFSVIRVVSSAYLRLLIFLPVILIPVYASSSKAFHMMYITYKLNKQSDNIQPWCTSFPIWNQSVPCLVLTVASWPAYWFRRRQLGSLVLLSFKNFPQFAVIHTVKDFNIVNEADIDVLLEFPCISHDRWTLSVWSLVPLLFLNPAWTSGSSRFTYCWSLAWRILSITLLACEMSEIVW